MVKAADAEAVRVSTAKTLENAASSRINCRRQGNASFNSAPRPKEEKSTMAPKSRKEAETEVRGWGFNHVFTWSDGPYPDDPKPKKEQCNVGDRFDVDANKRHEVWIGPEGCTYVIGE
ncbi:unnamed protein product [Aureobasidium uvarum]|uniref:Uncharacterized protein n=1 Tax=Aureobasidium uvarum TaxID=2773716 RepID=A0A9N8PXI2_9PEZI|nr:unnamed protein product [Aureobasidium uvarum]